MLRGGLGNYILTPLYRGAKIYGAYESQRAAVNHEPSAVF